MLLNVLFAVVASSISGCISDQTGHSIPGVTITAKSDHAERTAVASPAGCYELIEIPPGSYRVTARLPGFDNETRDGVVVAHDRVTHVDFELATSVICECIQVERVSTLAEAWQRADAVFRARVSVGDPRKPPPRGFYRHAAAVIEVYKRDGRGGPNGASIAVLEHQENAAPSPADSGQELVIFARWAPEASAFIGIGRDGGGVELAFFIDGGRVQAAPPQFSRYVGMPSEELVAEVRSASKTR